jgi:P-type Ca2+ transporter type 2C
MAFVTIALAQTVHAFNTRSQVESMFNKRFFSNPWLWSATLVCVLLQIAAIYVPLLQTVLHTAIPTAGDWMVIGLCSIAPVLVVEITKRASIPRRPANPERAGQAGQSR